MDLVCCMFCLRSADFVVGYGFLGTNVASLGNLTTVAFFVKFLDVSI